MTNRDTKDSINKTQDEPLFIAVPQKDPDFQNAYDKASETIDEFISMLKMKGDNYYNAKLRFRDPDESERLGEDRFVLIWLNDINYHEKENVLSGTFFEVPPEFSKWHQVGQKLAFDKEDVFDWMVLSFDGRLKGGFTLRVNRENMPENKRDEYDRYIGVKHYE